MDRDELYKIKIRINLLSHENRFNLVYSLITENLMRLPFKIKLIKWIFKWRFRLDNNTALIFTLDFLDKKIPASIDEMIKDTINWLLWGSDGTNLSIGGFNEEEILKLKNILLRLEDDTV